MGSKTDPRRKKGGPVPSGARAALIEARERRGLSRSALAQRMGGASRHYIYHIEMGQRDPSFEFMKRWVAALGTDASMELFGSWRLKMYETVEWLDKSAAA